MNLESISSENINKELAYLLGVYLTDGSISSFVDKWGRWYNFSLKAIDRDFVEFTLDCIKKLNPECKANVYEIRDTKKDIKINLIAFGEWLVLDEEYYRKMKLKKICSKLGKR